MMNEILNATLLLMLPLLVAFMGFNLCRAFFGASVMRHGVASRVYRLLGLIGTPIHELSHLIVALLFGHKVRAVKLFAWNSDAYVIHDFNSGSWLQVAGNFFIAMAPFITSTLVIYLLWQKKIAIDFSLQATLHSSLSLLFQQLPSVLFDIITQAAWCEVAFVAMLSFYCVPSNTDFSNAKKSAIYALPLLFIVIGICMLATDIRLFILTTLVFGFLSCSFALVSWSILFSISKLHK